MRTIAPLLFPALITISTVSLSDTSLGVEEKLKAVYDLYRTNEVVTLSQHETNIGLSFGYALNETRVLGLQDTTRTLTATALAGYGITDRVQLSLSTPLVYQTRLAQDPTTTYLDTSTAGIGNVTLGLAASLPTTTVATTLLASVALPSAEEGVGNAGLVTSIGINVDKVLQPAFVYGGLSWLRDWDADTDAVGYSAGVGFFLNYALSVGAGLEGSFLLNPAQGLPHDTMALVGRVSYQATPSFGFTPSIAVGLTEGAPDVALGLSMVWRF